jgi:probable addiction module antidote protein
MTKMSKKSKMPPLTPAKVGKARKDVGMSLKAALDTADADLFLDALGAAVRAKGSGRIAKKAGISEKTLAGAFSGSSRSEFAAFLTVVRAVGLKLTITAA